MASIEKRTNAAGKTSYRVKWREGGTRDGGWQSETFTRQADARDWKSRVEANGHRRPDGRTPVTDPGSTVPALVTAYLDDREKRVRSDRTVADYRRDAAAWITPAFTDVPADDLTDEQVQAWIDGIDRAAKTVANIHGILSGAYKWGQRKGHVSHNPCVGTELPQRGKRITRGLRSGQWEVLHRAAVETNPEAADLLLFLVGTGWRWSEASALQVMDCDLDRNDPRVTVTKVWRRDASHRNSLVNDAKSRAGYGRVAKLTPMVADMLRRRTTGKPLGEFVFTGPTGKPLSYSNFHTRAWVPILERAEQIGLTVRPTIHWLRHTHVVLLIEAGASLPEIQKRVGHESITTTVNVYGSLIDDVGETALAGLDDALRGRKALRLVEGGATDG